MMKNDEIDVNKLKKKIQELNLELDKKNQEINLYLDKINDHEEELMKFHELISETPSTEDIKKMIENKFDFELKEKDREIRDLKNRMGFLRQEKIILQRDFEELRKKSMPSAKSIEEIKEKQRSIDYVLNLETSIKELRKKLYTHEIIMENLKEELNKKEETIENLNLTINLDTSGLSKILI